MPQVLRKKGILAVVGIFILLVVTVILLRLESAVDQPITFNHKVHVGGIGLECSHCHVGVENGPFASLPKTEICLACHVVPLSENSEEAKVREYGGEKGEIPWQRLTQQPDHVYFSHRRHVKFAKIPCQQCHGKMEERTEPPSRAPMELFMEDCIGCHEQQKASTDCISCHR